MLRFFTGDYTEEDLKLLRSALIIARNCLPCINSANCEVCKNYKLCHDLHNVIMYLTKLSILGGDEDERPH